MTMMRHATRRRNFLARWWARRAPFDQLMIMALCSVAAGNLIVLSILLTLSALFPRH